MRVIRIVELPALEAARVRLVTWWSGLSSRERILVATLGALLALVVLVYGVVKPLQAARADAVADIRTYETLNARIRAAGSLGAPAGPPPRTGTPETIVATSAQGFALQPAVQPVPGGVRATFTDASYDAVVNWMTDLARTSSLTATRVELRRGSAAGRVNAVVELRG